MAMDRLGNNTEQTDIKRKNENENKMVSMHLSGCQRNWKRNPSNRNKAFRPIWSNSRRHQKHARKRHLWSNRSTPDGKCSAGDTLMCSAKKRAQKHLFRCTTSTDSHQFGLHLWKMMTCHLSYSLALDKRQELRVGKPKIWRNEKIRNA